MASTQKSTTSLYSASLDPMETKHEYLRPPFLPHRRILGREDAKYAFETPGFLTLPRILIPQAKHSLKPPIMHYGWPVELEDLVEYAAQHGLTQYNDDFVEKQMSSDDEDSTSGSDNGKGWSLTSSEMIKTVDEGGSAMAALRHIVKSIDEAPSSSSVTLGPVAQFGHPVVLSIYTNYTLKDAPTDAFKIALCEKLHLSGEPRWYLDVTCWHWHTGNAMFICDCCLCL